MGFYENIMSSTKFDVTKVGPNLKMFNSQKWVMECSLLNVQQGLQISLVTQNINRLIIDNDIDCFSPTVELTYFDIGQSITKGININNMLLNIHIVQPSPNQNDPHWNDQKLLTYDSLYCIIKNQVILKQQGNIMYRFTGIHYNQTYLKKNINFATVKQNDDSNGTPESPLVLINKILSKIGYPYDKIVNDTTNRINFISSQTMNVGDYIDYLLRFTPTKNDPPSYFVHNIRLNKAQLINSKTIEQRLVNPCNVFSINGTSPTKPITLDLATELGELTNQGFNAGILAEQYLGNYEFNNYSQNKREWTKTIYNYSIINNIFNKYITQKNKNYQSIFPDKKEVQRNDLYCNFPNFTQRKMYDFLREIQVTTNSIRFRVLGNTTRDAGQYVELNCTDDTQKTMYQGMWNIYSCRHMWNGRIYYNELVCYRTFELKPKWQKNNVGTVY